MELNHSAQQHNVNLRRLAWAAIAGIVLLCLVLGNRNWKPPTCFREAIIVEDKSSLAAAETSSTAAPAEYASVAVVVGSANHKTGSKQLVCLGKAVRAAVDTNVTIKIITNTTASDTAMIAAAGRAKPEAPSFLVTYFHSSHQCYGLSRTNETFICPRAGFPCGAHGSATLSLDGCYFALPSLPVGVLHFVRNPWDVVTSAYWYHQQDPAPEAWIDVEFSRRARSMMGEGVPHEAIKGLGLDLSSSDSYGDLLRTLPEEDGIVLEFWRSAPGLYAMARQYQFFQQHPGGLQMRYEDLQADWNAAVARLARRFYPRHIDALVKQAQSCDVGNWSQEKLESSNHVTAAKHSADDKQRLQRVLAEQPEVRRHLCSVCAALEYVCEPWCTKKGRRQRRQ